MKKLLTLLCALVASAGTLFASVIIDGIAYNLNDIALTAEVTSKSDPYIGSVVIPASVVYDSTTYAVTGIGDAAFEECMELSSISLPEGLLTIGTTSFFACTELTEIILPNSLTTIGDLAFAYCSSLEGIYLPENVSSIGTMAFSYMSDFEFAYSNFTHIDVAPGNPYFCSYHGALFDKSMLKLIVCPTGKDKFNIPDGTQEIGIAAFTCNINLTELSIPNSVTKIGEAAFANCWSLQSLVLPQNLQEIGLSALTDLHINVSCLAEIPPTISAPMMFTDPDLGYGSSGNVTLFVPAQSVQLYKQTDVWKNIQNISPINAISVVTEEEIVISDSTETSYSVDIVWPVVSGAASYELVVKDEDSTVICTLIFDSNGQLTSIVFHAPARGKAHQYTQTAGFSFQITGLEAGSTYTLTIVAKNEDGQEIDRKSAQFSTASDSTTGIGQITTDQTPVTNKVIKDGHIFILQGEKVYTLQGQEVR